MFSVRGALFVCPSILVRVTLCGDRLLVDFQAMPFLLRMESVLKFVPDAGCLIRYARVG